MKRLFNFKCDYCDRISEELVEMEIREAVCTCGELARRMVSTPGIRLEGISGDFPTAHDHWANIREQNARVKARRKENA